MSAKVYKLVTKSNARVAEAIRTKTVYVARIDAHKANKLITAGYRVVIK